jgi:hypothetical protein
MGAMNAKQDAERLMNEVVPVAKRMLEDYGEFFPYGAYLKPSGEIVHIGGDDHDTDHPRSKDLLYVLRDSFSAMAKVGECIATAIVFGVVVDKPNTHSKSDAIQVCLEHLTATPPKFSSLMWSLMMVRSSMASPSRRKVSANCLAAVTGEVELYDMGYRYSTSSDGGTRGGLETVGPVCAAG